MFLAQIGQHEHKAHMMPVGTNSVTESAFVTWLVTQLLI